MKVIVDANIVFSAILNTDSKIGYLLLNSVGIIEFVAPAYMSHEIKKYYPKIEKLTGKTHPEVAHIHSKVTANIVVISEDAVPSESWSRAENMVFDIDQKDTPYIAFSDFLKVKIWTGDNALRDGLKGKNQEITVSTNELYEYHQRNIKK